MNDSARQPKLATPDDVDSDGILARCYECIRTIPAEEIRRWAAEGTYRWWQWQIFGLCDAAHYGG